MRSAQTIGDEFPDPGTGTRHFTLVVGDHVFAYFPGTAWPWPDGPRHRGQYRAPSPVTATRRTSVVLCDCRGLQAPTISVPAIAATPQVSRPTFNGITRI